MAEHRIDGLFSFSMSQRAAVKSDYLACSWHLADLERDHFSGRPTLLHLMFLRAYFSVVASAGERRRLPYSRMNMM